MAKWKVESVPDVVDGLARHYVTDGDRKFQIAQGTSVANELSSLLNNLEEQNAEMQEERRWRKIGEEWPERDWQECEVKSEVGVKYWLRWNKQQRAWVGRVRVVEDGRGHDYLGCKERYVRWRPAPTDVPKEEV